MQQLSPQGQQAIAQIASRHGFSIDATTHMLWAVYHGNGSMAQFSHGEFAGSGQWMRGGMIMLGDMFNNQLKGRVDALCNDLSQLLASQRDLIPAPVAPTSWWPDGLGSPSASGGQNQLRYAWFADSRRLAVDSGGDVWVYDTLDHHIGGFSQQQGSGSGITLSSQYGTVDLGSLPVVMRNGQAVQTPMPIPAPAIAPPPFEPVTYAPPPPVAPPPAAPASGAPSDADAIFASIERLGELHSRGLLSEQEFIGKKAELLGRL
ncbi:hypothetical protein C7444_11331 [Sphaerotilus hippei]|uniref:Uncharacterized protein n=1 Tax=Sphaerotilus hippei TaxID=744406 RepID=A0A318GXJ8_9BURK|nr:SHOCT domain-containing protein [Sphaerotilus hippei]PXW94540.1 hypothetical protein C7444_11331 [Sphaerotilus hippei]